MHMKDTVYGRWDIKGGRGGETQDKRECGTQGRHVYGQLKCKSVYGHLFTPRVCGGEDVLLLSEVARTFMGCGSRMAKGLVKLVNGS